MKIYINNYKNNLYGNEIFTCLKNNDIDVEFFENDENLTLSEQAFNFSDFITNSDNLGIIVDEYTIGSYNGANKVPNSICAPVSDEHSAHMTREHNGTKIICIGSALVGLELAKSIALKFVNEDYAGGRHQVRLDMMKQIDNGGL